MKTNRPIKKFPLFIRIIATILLVTFVVQDIAWAHPDPFTKDPSRHATLAPETMFERPEDEAVAISKLLQSKIESHHIFKGNVTLEAIEHILDLKDISEWCRENNVSRSVERTFTGKPKEIRLLMPYGHVLRYYDPNILTNEDQDAAKYGTIVHVNANLHTQAIKSGSLYNKASPDSVASTYVDTQAAVRKGASSSHVSPFQQIRPSLYERVSNYGIIAISTGLIFTYWLMDTLAYMHVSSDSNFLSSFMPADPYRYFTRVATACIIFLFGAVIQFFAYKNKKIAIALSERNQMFFQFFTDMGVAAYRLDVSGNILDVNKKWCDWMGYTREEAIGRPIFDFIDPEQRANARDRLLGRIRGFTETEIPQRTGDRKYIRKDGKEILSDTFNTILRDRFGQPVEILTQFRDITEQRRTEKELEKLSEGDELTGAYNRNYWERHFNIIFEAFSRTRVPISAIMCDLDDFKLVNDKDSSHLTGDAVLKEFAKAMLGEEGKDRRKTDFVIRVGGDEFFIVLFNTDIKGATTVAKRILEKLATNHNVLYPDGKPISIKASMGVVQFREGQTKQEFFDAADKALYIAKHSGKNRLEVVKPSFHPAEGESSPEGKMAFKRVVENIRTKPRKYSDITTSEKFVSNMAEIRKRLKKLGMEDILGDLRDLRVLVTDAVVLGHGDYSVGFFSQAESDREKLVSMLGEDEFARLFPKPTLVLPKEIFDQYDVLIQQDYILHRILCCSKGHYPSMFIQQAVYPENYAYGLYEEEDGKKYMPGHKGEEDKPFKGRTGEAIQNIISAITKDPITTVIMHDLKNKIQGGYMLDIVLKKYGNAKVSASEGLQLLKKYRDMMELMGKTTLSFYANGANEIETVKILSDMLPELKQMTAAIKSRLDAGRFDYDKDDKNYIERVIKNSEEGVIPGINAVINMLGRSPEEVNLAEFIRDIVERARSILVIPEGTSVELSITDIAKPLKKILTYKLILKLTLEELLKNASVDGKAKRIKVEVSATSDGELKVTVRDYGKGMSEESLKRLFMPGNTEVENKGYGSGYGLAVLKEAIDSVGGTIMYDKKITDGASFTFTLPVDAPLNILDRRRFKEPLMVTMCGRKGSGRSTVGRMVAAIFGLRYVDSGFILRAMLYKLLEAKRRGSAIHLDDPKAVGAFAKDFFNKKRIDYSNEPVIVDGVDSAKPDANGLSLRDKIKMLISNKEMTDGRGNEDWLDQIAAYEEVGAELENFIRAIAVEAKAYSRYNGIVRAASDPVKSEEVINIMLDASTYIRAKRSHTSIEDIEERDSKTGRKNITSRYARVDLMIDTAHLTVRQTAMQAKGFINATVVSKKTVDGFISQGDAAFTRMAENIASGKFVDATHDPRMVLDIERLKNRLGLRSIDDIMGTGSAVRILVTNGVMIKDGEFSLGFYSESPAVKARLIQIMGDETFKRVFPKPTVVLTTEVLLNKDENVRQEYIYHEVICHAKGHYEAIFAQQKIFSENYTGDCEEGSDGFKYMRGFAGVKDKPFKGRLGIALTSTVKMSTDPIMREVLHDLNGKLSTVSGFALYSVLKKYPKDEIAHDEKLRLLEEYRTRVTKLAGVCVGYLKSEATTIDVMNTLSENLKPFTRLTNLISEKFNNHEYDDITPNSKKGVAVLLEESVLVINLMNRAVNWIGRSMDSVDIEDFVKKTLEAYMTSLKESGAPAGKYLKINPPKVSEDVKRLKDVFTYKEVLRMTIEELVKNAVKYSGTETIDVEISLTRDGDLEFKVIDKGKGISEDRIKKLFTPGFTEARDSRIGTGYGLISLKTAIESVGGTISVESKVDRGTVFRFTLPANGEIDVLKRPKLYDPILVALSGLRGAGRTVVSRWIASRLGLRYINPRFMMRAMVVKLLEARKNGREIDLKDEKAVSAFAEEFFGTKRLDYSVEPVKLDGVDTSVPDARDGLSLRDKIKIEINDGFTDETSNKIILDNISKYAGVQAALEKFIKSIASDVRASGKYNGVIRPGTEPVKDKEAINIMLDASSYIRASRANESMDEIEAQDERTNRKNMADRYPYIDIIDTSYSSVEEVGTRALGYIMNHIPITDGMVRKGDKAFSRMLGNVINGKFEDKSLTLAADLKDVSKIIGVVGMEELTGSDKPLRVFAADAVVVSQSDFSFGFYSHAPPVMAKIISLVGDDVFNRIFPEPTFVLSSEILDNPNPRIRQEYILHEILCHTKGHFPAIFEEQRLFPENYNSGAFEEHSNKKYMAGSALNEAMPFDGAFGDALRQVVTKKLATTTTGEFIRLKEKERAKTSDALVMADLIKQAEKLKVTSMQEKACVLMLKALSLAAESDQPVPYESIADVRAFMWDEKTSGHVSVNFDLLLGAFDEYLKDCNLPRFRARLKSLAKPLRDAHDHVLSAHVYKQLSHLFLNSISTVGGIAAMLSTRKYQDDPSVKEVADLSKAMELSTRNLGDESTRLRGVDSLMDFLTISDERLSRQMALLNEFKVKHAEPLRLDSRLRSNIDAISAEIEKLTRARGMLALTLSKKLSLEEMAERVDLVVAKMDTGIKTIPRIAWVGGLEPNSNSLTTVNEGESIKVNIRVYIPGFMPQQLNNEDNVEKFAESFIKAQIWTNAISDPSAGLVEAFQPIDMRFSGIGGRERHDYIFTGFIPAKYINQRDSNGRPKEFRFTARAAIKNESGGIEGEWAYSDNPNKTNVNWHGDGRIVVMPRRPEETSGNLVGRVFSDKNGKDQVTHKISGRIEDDHLVLYSEDGKGLYTKDGKEARVKLESPAVATDLGYKVYKLAPNDHIHGFASRENVFMADFMFYDRVLMYHEMKEAYYSVNPDEVPEGVEPHTYLRGCGKGMRDTVVHALRYGKLSKDFTAGQLKVCLKFYLRPGDERNDSEMRLIEYNASKGKKGMALLYGEQDRVFGPKVNMRSTEKISGKIRSRNDYSLSKDKVVLAVELMKLRPEAFPNTIDAAVKMLGEGFDVFKRYDFQGQAPVDATHYYAEYKKWYEALTKLIGSDPSVSAHFNSIPMASLLEALREQYGYINAKLNWAWAIEGMWTDVLSGMDKYARESQMARFKGLRIFERHDGFMKDYAGSYYIENDEAVRAALKVVEDTLGFTYSRVPHIFVKEEKSEKPVLSAKVYTTVAAEKSVPFGKKVVSFVKSGRASEIAQFVALAFIISIGLSWVLPANWLTLSIAIIVPVTLFFLLPWTWKTLVANIAIGAVLWYWLPLPWFGLSMAILTIANVARHNIKLKPHLKPVPQAKVSGENKGTIVLETVPAERAAPEEKKAKEILASVTIDQEILARILKAIEASKEGAGKADAGDVLKNIDNATILMHLFDLGTGTREDKVTKERLRPEVKKALKDVEGGSNPEFKDMLKSLKNWKNEKDEVLATSLQGLSPEILEIVLLFIPFEEMESGNIEMLTIRELIVEECGIDAARFEAISTVLREKLRLDVRRVLEDIKGGFSIESKDMISRLKNWKNEKDEDLATALQDLSQEVMPLVTRSNCTGDDKADMLAVREMIAEECGIDAARFKTIRLKLVLNVMRDDVASNQMIGTASAKDYFLLGILELKFENYTKAEASLNRAVELDPTNADYRLALGLVKHIFRKWMAARTAYNAASNFYAVEAGMSKVTKAKKELADFLLDKARAEVPLIAEKKPSGNLIGKLFVDKAATVQITEGIVAKEEAGFLSFFAPSGDILYTKTGAPAAVKLTGQIIKTKSGHQIKIIEDNEHIRGFADKDNTYLAGSFTKNPIAKYHESQESYYAVHPEELPKGVNSHTYIRGCGNDAREALRTSRKKDLRDITADDLIKYLKKRLPKERHNENEFNLIKYNGEQGGKGLDLIYGLQDREFGVEANELFSDALIILEKSEPTAQTAPKTQLRTSDEVLFRDYFEDLFEKNIEMFTLLSVRMMGSDAEKEGVLKRRNALVQELLALTDKYRPRDFTKEEYRKVVGFVDERILRTVELIDNYNEPAANLCLFGAINKISDTRLEMQAKWLSGIKERRARIWRNGGILTYPRGGYRILEGSKRTVIDRTEATFSSMWEVMRSLFHQVDRELEEKRKVSGLIHEIDGFMLELFDKNYELDDDERAAISKKISLLAASMAKEKGELKDEDKRIAMLLLNASGTIARLGNRHLKSVKRFLEMAMNHLKVREENAVSIATHCNNSGLSWVWVQSLRRDARIRNMANYALKCIDRKDRRSAIGVMKGITKLNEIKNEPEYKSIYNILWPVIKRIEENRAPLESARATLGLILEKYNNSRLLHNMLRDYRDKLIDREIARDEPVDKDALLKEIFDAFAARPDFPKGPNPVQARARWWAKLNQAVNISLMIDDPAGPGRRINNPAFEAASAYLYILEFGKLDELVNVPFMKGAKFNATRAYLESVLKRRPVGHLIRTDMPDLVAALAKDYGLDADQAKLLNGCIKMEDPAGIPASIKLGSESATASSLIKDLDNMRIIDNKDEYFRLRIVRGASSVYSDKIVIAREATGEEVGSVEINVREAQEGGAWNVEIGLAQLNDNLNGVNYRRRGIFPMVMNLLGKIVPEGSKMNIGSLVETESLKALATGRSWYQTKMGKIFYRNGWKLETLFIYDRGTRTYVAFDRTGVWKEKSRAELAEFKTLQGKAAKDMDEADLMSGATVIMGASGFRALLRESIKDIDTTDNIYGATVGATLSKINRSGEDGYISQGQKSRQEFLSMVDRIRSDSLNEGAKEHKGNLISLAGTYPVKGNFDRLQTKKFESVLTRLIEGKYKIYTFDSIVKGKDDFFLGWHDMENGEIFIARDLVDFLKTRGPPSVLYEYLAHEITCPILGHYRAILVQQKAFTDNYPDEMRLAVQTKVRPYKGLLGTLMREFIELKRAEAIKAPVLSKETVEDLFKSFMEKAEALRDVTKDTSAVFKAGEDAKEKGLILYADNILEQGAAIGLEQVLRDTDMLNGATIIVYGKKPGMAQVLEKIIRKSNKTTKVTTVGESELIATTGAKDIYIDEAKELASLIKHAGAKGINNGKLLGVIKGPTDPASVDSIKELLADRKTPVVSFESETGVYSFANALSVLMRLKKNIDPKFNNWFAVLPPIKKLSVEIDKTYQEYREALKRLLSAA